MIATIDRWLGKHLFVPPVIRLCQVTGLSQYAVYRWGWLAAAMAIIWASGWTERQEPFVLMAFLIACAIGYTVYLALWPDWHEKDHPFARKCFLFLEALHLGRHALFEAGLIGPSETTKWGPSCAAGLIILFAEYALTIKTIPPLETKEAKRKLVNQKA